jgi:heterodisulfide reductase subunit B
MKEFLHKLKSEDFDGLNFYRNEHGLHEVSGFEYKKAGQKIGGTELGDLYHIIIFQEEPLKMPEIFEAILVSPIDYVSRMMEDGFLGIVSKVTTTSHEVAKTMFEAMSLRVSEYIKQYEEIKNDE